MKPASAMLVACLLGSFAGCTTRPRTSDTGYTGTWVRENLHNISIVAIAKSGDRYLFRWRKLAFDAPLEIVCEWDGRCEETFEGKRAATYEFKTRIDERTGHLLVEYQEVRIVPAKVEYHYVDELEVDPGGKVLRSYTIEQNGQTFAGLARPVRSFEKIADAVAGVPDGATRAER